MTKLFTPEFETAAKLAPIGSQKGLGFRAKILGRVTCGAFEWLVLEEQEGILYCLSNDSYFPQYSYGPVLVSTLQSMQSFYEGHQNEGVHLKLDTSIKPLDVTV